MLTLYPKTEAKDNSMNNSLNIGVFTSASSKLNEHYFALAKALGSSLAKAGHTIIYGGAQIGMMGALANAALENNGRVIGVFPENLGGREIAHPNLTEQIFTKGLHERKQVIYQKSDFFISLPGGFGTLDETFEVLTWNQLGHIQKPLYFFNANHFYDHLIQFIAHLEKDNFIKVYDSVGINTFNDMSQLPIVLNKELKRKYAV